jgi:protein MPE1
MVVARRLPAARPGHGKAARYVSGRMPVSAKNSYRTEKTSTAGTSSGPDHLAAMNNAKTEQDKIAAMFAAEGDQWKKQQQEMAK